MWNFERWVAECKSKKTLMTSGIGSRGLWLRFDPIWPV